MTKASVFLRIAAAAGAAFLVAATSQSALAAAPAAGGAAPPARVLVVDLRRAIGMSKVGQSIQEQVEGLKKQMQAKLNGEAEGLKRERAEMEAQNAIMSASIKAQKENAWKARAASFEKRVQESTGLIQGGMYDANRQVEEALGPILQGIMQERRATILLDRNAILIAPNAIDVTGDVIRRLDVKMTTLKVELKQLPKNMQQ